MCESCNILQLLCNTKQCKRVQFCTMKTKKIFIALVITFWIGAWVTTPKVSAQGGSVNFQVFYDNLSPYGTWVDSPEYGYVWVPDVAPGFTPYATNGHWIYTDEGWTWVSDYPWGWAPFHYGRWYTDPNYGPIWVPDNEWGPGWVTWRRSGDYYGWAPIGPGISIDVAYTNGYNLPENQWTFVRNRDFGRTNINNYYVNSSNNTTIIHNSTVINNARVDRTRNVTYNTGPSRTEVEKTGGRPITPVAIKESNKPGQSLNKNQLQIYRPQVQKVSSNGQKPVPSKVASLKDVKPPAQRTGANPGQKVNPSDQHHPLPPVRTTQPAKQQQPAQQRNVQPAKQLTPGQQQRTVQPAKQQQAPQQHNAQPPKQQQPQQHNAQPPKQQQHNAQPAKQQQPQNAQPPKQQQSQPQHENTPQPKQENPPH
jgi:hypothetical protein